MTRARAALAVAFSAFVAPSVHASNPLEYPDNGSASFSRGGAWLALGNEPIATHYNPAGLALQASGFSLEQQLALPHTCYDRRGPGNAVVGPSDTGTQVYQYRPVCNSRAGFPNAIPSLSVVYRASARLGFGVSIVPPATYGSAEGQLPPLARGFDTLAGQPKEIPAPYRYMQLEQQTTILFPTASVGYELFSGFRIGAGFISGIGVINLGTAGVASLQGSDAKGDHMADDSLSTLRTEDLFIPGVVLSLDWSISRLFDVAVWGRYMDALRSHNGSLDVTQQPFDGNGNVNPPCAGIAGPAGIDYTSCSSNQSVPNHFPNAVTLFEYRIPPEVRAGIRFHVPRSSVRKRLDDESNVPIRDPLHDELFDVELDGSFTQNSGASEVIVRFPGGEQTLITKPTKVPVPPNADRPSGFRDSFGARFGGQWNAIADLFAVRAGAWLETQSQDPAFLTVAPVGAFRFGFGGGLVVRYHFLDVSIGYQRHLSAGLDNHGDGRLRAPAAVNPNGVAFDKSTESPNVSAANRTAFRTIHAVNGGSVSFDANVFTLGGVARF